MVTTGAAISTILKEAGFSLSQNGSRAPAVDPTRIDPSGARHLRER